MSHLQIIMIFNIFLFECNIARQFALMINNLTNTSPQNQSGEKKDERKRENDDGKFGAFDQKVINLLTETIFKETKQAKSLWNLFAFLVQKDFFQFAADVLFKNSKFEFEGRNLVEM